LEFGYLLVFIIAAGEFLIFENLFIDSHFNILGVINNSGTPLFSSLDQAC